MNGAEGSNFAKLILASASPRRKLLLEKMGLLFEIVHPEVDESSLRYGDPEKLAIELAKLKARSVAERYPDRVVLGADTIAVLKGKILGKPADAEDARRILRSLSGTTHRVISAVCLTCLKRAALTAATEVSLVRMKELSDEEINAYVDSGEALGKAGAYALQENADKFATLVSGSFENVVGLPIDTLKKMLPTWGFQC